jgi:hypothetical protein
MHPQPVLRYRKIARPLAGFDSIRCFFLPFFISPFVLCSFFIFCPLLLISKFSRLDFKQPLFATRADIKKRGKPDVDSNQLIVSSLYKLAEIILQYNHARLVGLMGDFFFFFFRLLVFVYVFWCFMFFLSVRLEDCIFICLFFSNCSIHFFLYFFSSDYSRARRFGSRPSGRPISP